MDYPRPVMLVSSCLGGGQDYRGKTRKNTLAEDLKAYAEIRTVCPEALMGLAAPRDPLRIVEIDGERHLIHPQTQEDFTQKSYEISSKFLKNIRTLDGCILKKYSPTCGIRDVKIYGEIGDENPVKRGKGLFTTMLEERFPNVLMEDERRLENHKTRESFLTSVFTKADFRRVRDGGDIRELQRFHDRNKLLLMACSKTRHNEMEKLFKQNDASFAAIGSEYELLLNSCISRTPRTASHKNVLKLAFTSFVLKLKEDEIEYFNSRLALYEADKLRLSEIKTLFRSYILRFSDEHLAEQTYFSPYPEELNDTR